MCVCFLVRPPKIWRCFFWFPCKTTKIGFPRIILGLRNPVTAAMGTFDKTGLGSHSDVGMQGTGFRLGFWGSGGPLGDLERIPRKP